MPETASPLAIGNAQGFTIVRDDLKDFRAMPAQNLAPYVP
jgi:hypothetical protein